MRNFSEQIERLNYAVEQTAAPETIDKLRALYEQRSKYNADFDRKYETLTKTIYEIDPNDRDTSAEALRARDELKTLASTYLPGLEPIASQIEQLLSECNNAYIESVRGDKDRVLQDAAATMEADKGNFIDLRSFESTIANTCMAYLHPEARRSYKVEDPTRPGEYIETPSEYITAANRKYDQEHDLYSLLNGLAIFFVIFDLEGWNKAELERLAWENLPYLVTESGEIEPNVFTKEWQAKKNMPLAELVKEMERNSAAAGMPGEPTDSETAAKELLNKISEIERTALNIPLEGYYKFSNNTLGRIPKPAAGTLGEYQNITFEGWEDEEATEEVNSSFAPYFRIRSAYEKYRDGLRPSVVSSVLSLTNALYPTGAGMNVFSRATVTRSRGKSTVSTTYEFDGLKIRQDRASGTGKSGLLTLKLGLLVSHYYIEQNPYKGKPRSPDVYIPYADFETLCYGTDPVTERTKKERRQRIRKAIDALRADQFTFGGSGAGYAYMFPVSRLIPKVDIIHVRVLDEWGATLLNGKRTYYPREIYLIDNDDTKSFLLAQYLCQNYNRTNRQAHGEANRIQIKSIVEKSECFPDHATMPAKYKKRDIAEVIFKCLEKLTTTYHVLSDNPSYSFMLRNPGGTFTDDINVYGMSYPDILKVYVHFELNSPEDNSERVQKFLDKEAEYKEKPKEKKTTTKTKRKKS